jgi:Uma2 family endonuclease
LAKADEYLAAGSRLVWAFDPIARVVLVRTPDGQTRTLTAADELDGSDVLPDFRVPVAELFQ